MKLLYFGIFVINCGLVLSSPLLDCLHNCDETQPSTGHNMKCKKVCYEIASKGGHDLDNLDECLRVCQGLYTDEEKADCISACSFLFPYKRGIRERKRPPVIGDEKYQSKRYRRNTVTTPAMRTWL